jgi:hypothetical protein
MNHHHDSSKSLTGQINANTDETETTKIDVDERDSGNNILYCTKTTTAEVRQVKLLVILVVLFSICGAVSVFFYTKSSENQQFQRQYDDDSSKVNIL